MVLVDELEFTIYMGSRMDSGETRLTGSRILPVIFRSWCFHIAVVCVIEQVS